jgi:hypothetical protein
LECVS